MCLLGYTGRECSFQCQYPSYGQDCYNTCDCLKESCDFMFGCKHASDTGNFIKLCAIKLFDLFV